MHLTRIKTVRRYTYTIVIVTMHFRSNFMEISKVAYFQKAYDIRNVKSMFTFAKVHVLILITF